MTRTALLDAIHDHVSDAGHGQTVVIKDETWINALMQMTPSPETVRRGDRWLESRSERLGGGRWLVAIISREEDGRLRVTAHADHVTSGPEWRRIQQDILGREPGVRFYSMNAMELIGRTVVNENGAAFHVGGLRLDGTSGRIWIDLLDLDEDDMPIPGTECGISTLDGWRVC